MKRILLLLPMYLLVLAACGANTSNSQELTPSDSTLIESETITSESEVTSESSEFLTSEVVSSEEDDLPPPPPTSVLPVIEGSVVVDGEIPGGWTYITNNPEYPNPEFYSDGGLKLNYANQAILSPIFENDYTTIGLEGKINKNTRTGTTPSTLTVYTVEGEKEVEVGSISFPPESASTFTTSFTLEAGSAQFLIKLTSNVGYNINLKTITFA